MEGQEVQEVQEEALREYQEVLAQQVRTELPEHCSTNY